MTGFAAMQRAYAEHGVATYPLTEDKKPAITNFQRVGLAASSELAKKFSDATALGFVAGLRNRVTVVDIDSQDDALVAAARSRFGETPLQVLTPSGGRHLYYRYAGEPRKIRAFPDVDILGAGAVVAVGSRLANGKYEFERGSLEDLSQLSPIRSEELPQRWIKGPAVHEGRRNIGLWEHCMRAAKSCDSFDALLDVARTFNADAVPPLAEIEVTKTAKSAWGYEQRGENRFGRHGAWFPQAECDALWGREDALLLLMKLRSLNGPDAEFWVADGFARLLGWNLVRLRLARRELLALGYVDLVRTPMRGRPALYRWTGRRHMQGSGASGWPIKKNR